jgi:hypothetical protein
MISIDSFPFLLSSRGPMWPHNLQMKSSDMLRSREY